jgi:hypothetical protein
MKIILEFDDLHPHPEVDCIHIIDELVKRCPHIILNFFTVPEFKGSPICWDTEWCDKIKGYIDSGNLCLGMHGHLHTPNEFKNISYKEAHTKIIKGEQRMLIGGLPFKKVWRSPHWGINRDTFQALIDLGYTHVYSHMDYQELNNKYKEEVKIAYYNFNLKDEWPNLETASPNDIIVCHGHTSSYPHLSCGNSIWEQKDKILKIAKLKDVEFLRINEWK